MIESFRQEVAGPITGRRGSAPGARRRPAAARVPTGARILAVDAHCHKRHTGRGQGFEGGRRARASVWLRRGRREGWRSTSHRPAERGAAQADSADNGFDRGRAGAFPVGPCAGSLTAGGLRNAAREGRGTSVCCTTSKRGSSQARETASSAVSPPRMASRASNASTSAHAPAGRAAKFRGSSARSRLRPCPDAGQAQWTRSSSPADGSRQNRTKLNSNSGSRVDPHRT